MYTKFKKKILFDILKMFDIFFMLSALIISLSLWGASHDDNLDIWELLYAKTKFINIVLLLIFILIWRLIFQLLGLYDSSRLEQGKAEGKTLLLAVLIGTMVLLAMAVFFQRGHVGQETLLAFMALAGVMTWGGRTALRIILARIRQQNRNVCRLLLVGSNHRAYNFIRCVLATPQLGYHIVGYIDDPWDDRNCKKLEGMLKEFGALQDLEVVIDREEIDEIVIALPIRSYYEQIQGIIAMCEIRGIQTHLLSDFFQCTIARPHVLEFDGIPILAFTTGTSEMWAAYLKRAFDVIVASVLMLGLAPLFLLLALLIKVCSPKGPVFFVQSRVGYNRRQFKMLKFRTMVPDAERLQASLEHLNEAQGPVFKIKNDPRITPIGRLLRKTSLDELPQLFNVIKGDMSLVGPRPLPLRDVERFEEAWLKRRFSVKPGITCLWQVSGRSDATFDTWIAQDLAYIDNWSFPLDLKILCKTIPAVVRGLGAH
jgi:exopolysaccharide biosynthesis polyprenyl glycosylphosphotransferase